MKAAGIPQHKNDGCRRAGARRPARRHRGRSPASGPCRTRRAATRWSPCAADDAGDSTDPRVVGDGGDPGAAALAGAWAVASGEAGFTGDCYELELTRAQGGGLPAGKRLFYKCVGIRWHVMVCGVTGKPQQQQAMV
jgi:hypothetical protein